MKHSQLLLLDLDDVLLFSHGYRMALRGAVGYFGRRLGYADVPLSDEDIDVFESFGLTAEWDSGTMCVSLLLTRLWEHDPDYPIPGEGEWELPQRHGRSVPKFREFIARLQSRDSGSRAQMNTVEQALFEQSPFLAVHQRQYLQELLDNTRAFERSPVHRLIQEFNLGSRMFSEYYMAQPMLTVESTLQMYDRPRLDETGRRRLLEWSEQPERGAVIFTNRPSTPPDGAFDTPEAELGLEASGLSGLRIVGGGGLAWISQRRGLRSGELLKPSPVHALAALRLALGDPLQDALEAAAALALDRRVDSSWMRLAGSELHVFEDSAKGLRSAISAAAILISCGIEIEYTLYGVSDSAPKRAALAEAGGSLFDDIQSALAQVDGLGEIAR